jgi:hypothetical protein
VICYIEALLRHWSGATPVGLTTARYERTPASFGVAGSQFRRFPQGSRMQHFDATDVLDLPKEGSRTMYALIRQYEGLDATMRETATKKANFELRPILANSPGFVSYELIQPEGKIDSVTSISVFNTRTDAEASSKVAEDWVHTNLPSMTKPLKVAGELVAH